MSPSISEGMPKALGLDTLESGSATTRLFAYDAVD